MIKVILLLSVLLMSAKIYSDDSNTITHDVIKDRLVKKGVIKISAFDKNAETIVLNMDYDILIKNFFISKRFKGNKNVDFPAKFLTPYGYQELEQVGQITTDKVIAKHLARVKIANHYDCQKIQITPRKKKDWDGIFVYCADIKSLGFARVEIRLKQLPFIGSHIIHTRLRE
jgi:hypothetical protein